MDTGRAAALGESGDDKCLGHFSNILPEEAPTEYAEKSSLEPPSGDL